VLSREARHGGGLSEPVARPLKQLVVLAVAAGLIAGCGSDDGSTSGSALTTDTTAAASAKGGSETELVVTLDPDGNGGKPALEQIVTCPSSGKDVCAAIADLPADATAEVPATAACTQIYGGADTLVLQGKINGEVVDAHLNRANGCEIDRFEAFVPMLEALYPNYKPGASGT
jgi:hypothetical protein